MKIVVNDIAASFGGALTVLKSFYDYIKENDTENEYIFLLSGAYLKETEYIKVILRPNVKKGIIHKLFFDFISGRAIINEQKPDYVLSLQNIITFGVRARQGTYIHQSIPFQNTKKFSFFRRGEFTLAVYQWIIGSIIKISAKFADDVFVQTKWMKESVSQKAKIGMERIHVIPFGNALNTKSESTRFLRNQFFYPATDENIYKNQKCIYDACSLLNARGMNDFEVRLTLEKESNINIKYVGRLEKADMIQNYQESVLIFPSYIETIGLPLIEARNVGTLILAADCEYSREVLDGYSNCYFFNPFAPVELADLMQRVMDGEIHPKTVEVKTKFKEEKTWELMLETIKENLV